MTSKRLALSSSILVATLLVVGCQNTAPLEMTKKNNATTIDQETSMTDGNIASVKLNITPEVLARYHWTLVSAVDNNNQPLLPLTSIKKQVTLNFMQQNNQNLVGFGVGCNSMGGDYQLNDNVMTVGNVVSTMMLCHDLNEAEETLSGLMSNDSQLSLKEGTVPILTQLIDNNATLVWQGQMTTEAKYGKGETVFWAVDHKAQPCPDGSTKTCLKVKPVRYNEQGIKSSEGDWTLFSGEIEGYTHDATQDQVLRLKRYVVDPSDVKGKQFAYVLDIVVESQIINE